MANFFVMEAVNLFVGDHSAENSKHLTLTELKLPDLQTKTTDHSGGGSMMDVDISLGTIEKLQPTFNLRGFDPSLYREFGYGSKSRRLFTAYGVVRDKANGGVREAKAVMEGILSRIAPEGQQRGEAAGAEYALSELFHYELFFDGEEIVYYDFLTNTVRLGGEEPEPEINSILRING